MMKNIENIIGRTVSEYNVQISERWGAPVEELEELWKTIAGVSEIKKKKPRKVKENDSEVAESVSASSVASKGKSKNKNVEGGCPYVFIKGKDEGTICNSKPKDGGEYCGRHQKYEGVGQKEKKKSPSVKSVTDKVAKPKSTPEKKPVEKVWRINTEIKKFWNPESGLVLKSPDERVVIGSYRDKKFEKLTSEDISICEKFGFKYEVEETKPKPAPKKSLSSEIVKTNMSAQNVEDILGELEVDENDMEEEEEEVEGEEEEKVVEEEEDVEEEE